MPILISGSLAYDYIMDFPDSFRNHILPDQLHILNVCFVVEQMKKNLGGCAGNIAYTMKLLEGEPIILAPLGSDAGEYLEHFKNNKISTDYVPIVKGKLTSSAHITTDKDDNQIIAYYNGAGDEAVNLLVANIKEPLELALITPTKKDAMLAHAKECYDRKLVGERLRIVFDPSHQLTAFDGRELSMLIGQADFYIGNDYEMKLTEEKTGWSEAELLQHVPTVIKTLGEHGSIIMTKDESREISPCPAQSVEDPTGAGDAYRAGFFTGFVKGYDLTTCGQVGSVAATYAVEHYGTQNHSFTREEFCDRFKRAYDKTLTL